MNVVSSYSASNGICMLACHDLLHWKHFHFVPSLLVNAFQPLLNASSNLNALLTQNMIAHHLKTDAMLVKFSCSAFETYFNDFDAFSFVLCELVTFYHRIP